jgi:hypothetical protein
MALMALMDGPVQDKNVTVKLDLELDWVAAGPVRSNEVKFRST